MNMFRRFFPYVRTFTLYVISGGTAAFADIGSYFILLYFDAWYILASVVSGALGFFTAFLLHKYVVFQRDKSFLKHLGRYFAVDMTNLAIITGLLFILVDKVGMDPGIAKFVALAPVVLWNFFVYKFVVYV